MKKNILLLTLFSTIFATSSYIFPMEIAADSGSINADFFDAVKRGDCSRVESLIESIENINIEDEYGRSAIFIASGNGYLNIVRLLSENGANPREINQDGNMPIHIAAGKGQLDIVKYLIENQRVDPNQENIRRNKPIHMAVINGRLGIVQYLIKREDVGPNDEDGQGNKPVHIATINGHLDIVKYLIENQRVDPNQENTRNNKPIHIATGYGHIEILQYLIEQKDVDPNEENARGNKPIHSASRAGHLDIVQYLIEQKNVDPNEENARGHKPIHFASSNGHIEILKYFLEKYNVDVDVNTVNREGITPLGLNLDSEKFNFNAMQYLVKNGANITETEIQIAEEWRKPSVKRYLQSVKDFRELSIIQKIQKYMAKKEILEEEEEGEIADSFAEATADRQDDRALVFYQELLYSEAMREIIGILNNPENDIYSFFEEESLNTLAHAMYTQRIDSNASIKTFGQYLNMMLEKTKIQEQSLAGLEMLDNYLYNFDQETKRVNFCKTFMEDYNHEKTNINTQMSESIYVMKSSILPCKIIRPKKRIKCLIQ